MPEIHPSAAYHGFSKIKLVVYHQWRNLIGWATSRLSSDILRVRVNQQTNRIMAAELRFAEDHSCIQWQYPSPDIAIYHKEAKSERVEEKLSKTPGQSD